MSEHNIMKKIIEDINDSRELKGLSQDVAMEEAIHFSINKAIQLRDELDHYEFFVFPTERLDQIHSWINSLDNWRHTAGILIADYRQQLAREYILNYVDLFNQESDKYIDFFMPGYVKVIYGDYDLKIGDIKYRFDKELYSIVIMSLRKFCGIKYRFSPLLILQEFENGSMTDKRIVIELNTEKAGLLFEDIFSIAHREVNIEAFSRELKMAQFKRLLPQIIKEVIKKLTGSSVIKVVVDNTDNLTRYNIKDRKE